MKNIVIAFLSLTTVGLFLTICYNVGKERESRRTLIENSYMTGCYNFAQHYCVDMEDDSKYECYKDALDFCPKQAEEFVKFVEGEK